MLGRLEVCWVYTVMDVLGQHHLRSGNGDYLDDNTNCKNNSVKFLFIYLRADLATQRPIAD
jgi:hypothetical protein